MSRSSVVEVSRTTERTLVHGWQAPETSSLRRSEFSAENKIRRCSEELATSIVELRKRLDAVEKAIQMEKEKTERFEKETEEVVDEEREKWENGSDGGEKEIERKMEANMFFPEEITRKLKRASLSSLAAELRGRKQKDDQFERELVQWTKIVRQHNDKCAHSRWECGEKARLLARLFNDIDRLIMLLQTKRRHVRGTLQETEERVKEHQEELTEQREAMTRLLRLRDSIRDERKQLAKRGVEKSREKAERDLEEQEIKLAILKEEVNSLEKPPASPKEARKETLLGITSCDDVISTVAPPTSLTTEAPPIYVSTDAPPTSVSSLEYCDIDKGYHQRGSNVEVQNFSSESLLSVTSRSSSEFSWPAVVHRRSAPPTSTPHLLAPPSSASPRAPPSSASYSSSHFSLSRHSLFHLPSTSSSSFRRSPSSQAESYAPSSWSSVCECSCPFDSDSPSIRPNSTERIQATLAAIRRMIPEGRTD